MPDITITADGEPAAAWDCEAYGPAGRDLGALCFVSGELHKRRCSSLAECRRVMTAERRLAAGPDLDQLRREHLAHSPDPVIRSLVSGDERGDGG